MTPASETAADGRAKRARGVAAFVCGSGPLEPDVQRALASLVNKAHRAMRTKGGMAKLRAASAHKVAAQRGRFILAMLRIISPAFVAEHRFHPTRKWAFDFAIPGELIAVEIDGGVHVGGRHSGGQGQAKDFEKFNEAALRGWRVLHVTPQQAEDGTLAALVKRALRGEELTDPTRTTP